MLRQQPIKTRVKDDVMVSFDVKSLLPSLPREEFISRVAEWLKENETSDDFFFSFSFYYLLTNFDIFVLAVINVHFQMK